MKLNKMFFLGMATLIVGLAVGIFHFPSAERPRLLNTLAGCYTATDTARGSIEIEQNAIMVVNGTPIPVRAIVDNFGPGLEPSTSVSAESNGTLLVGNERVPYILRLNQGQIILVPVTNSVGKYISFYKSHCTS